MRAELVLGCLTCLLVAACDGEGARQDRSAAQPVAVDAAEGAVCGMLVREQPAPRAQVVHRDGERAFLCSLGDLLVHLDAPSPHGRAVDVFVEYLDPQRDPRATEGDGLGWMRAEDAVYVVGVPRTGIMGEPVLVYRSREDARRALGDEPQAELLGFDALSSRWKERLAH